MLNPKLKELAEKIIYLLTNPDIAREMGESGYQKVKNEFNQEKWIQEILNCYHH